MESQKKYGLSNEGDRSQFNASENLISNIKFSMVGVISKQLVI